MQIKKMTTAFWIVVAAMMMVMSFGTQMVLADQSAPAGGTELRLQIGSTSYTLNGTQRQSDAAPFISTQGRTMVPLRLIAEALGAEVGWIEETRTVTINRSDMNLSLALDVPLPNNMGTPVSIGIRTFVPVTYVAESFGAQIRWDDATRTVYIYEPRRQPAAPATPQAELPQAQTPPMPGQQPLNDGHTNVYGTPSWRLAAENFLSDRAFTAEGFQLFDLDGNGIPYILISLSTGDYEHYGFFPHNLYRYIDGAYRRLYGGNASLLIDGMMFEYEASFFPYAFFYSDPSGNVVGYARHQLPGVGGTPGLFSQLDFNNDRISINVLARERREFYDAAFNYPRFTWRNYITGADDITWNDPRKVDWSIDPNIAAYLPGTDTLLTPILPLTNLQAEIAASVERRLLPPVAGAAIQAAMSEVYAAYLEVLQASIDRHGIVDLCTPGTTLFGLRPGIQYARLIDFDNNGIPELLIVYVPSSSDNQDPSSANARVYGYSNGMAQYLFGGSLVRGSSAYTGFYVATGRGGTRYFVSFTYHRSGNTTFFTSRDGVAVVALTTSYDEDFDTNHVDYFVNDMRVSYQEHRAAPENLLGINYYRGSVNQNALDNVNNVNYGQNMTENPDAVLSLIRMLSDQSLPD